MRSHSKSGDGSGLRSLAAAQNGIYYVSQFGVALWLRDPVAGDDCRKGQADRLLFGSEVAVGLLLAVSPDGKTILCATDSPYADLKLIENFR